MSVSSKAEGEASQKGLTGAAKRQYVGGAINRARHEKAASATPAARSKQQAHSYHREAVADARSQIRYHEAQIAGLREGLKMGRDLAKESKTPKRAKAAKRKLIPVGRVDPAALDPYQPPNPHALRQLYGDEQLSEALDRYSLDALKKSAAAHGVDPKASSKRVLVDRLAAKAQGKEQPPKPKRAPRPKKPPTIEQQIERAGGYVPKTPADKLRKLPVREMSDTQLMRDWENHPPERRRGVLEREMARRQAKAEKAQQPKKARAPKPRHS